MLTNSPHIGLRRLDRVRRNAERCKLGYQAARRVRAQLDRYGLTLGKPIERLVRLAQRQAAPLEEPRDFDRLLDVIKCEHQRDGGTGLVAGPFLCICPSFERRLE